MSKPIGHPAISQEIVELTPADFMLIVDCKNVRRAEKPRTSADVRGFCRIVQPWTAVCSSIL
ncbi:hypothetical protein WMW72_31710 [Paenibacillus filicis]|uniref:Uncharacterized protein n=1 Tax=Paenibacillus filicis TaxID=669464 RepID=A0ABU9DUC6_9BACL